MKKVFASVVVVLAFGAVSAVSALDLSVGGGGFFASDFGGQGVNLKGTGDYSGNKMIMTNPWLGGGVNLFFDATYAEIGLGLTFAGGSPHVDYKDKDTSYTETDKDTKFSGTFLNIGLLGKYPISLGDNAAVYPAVGIDYALCLAAQSKYKDEDPVKLDGKDGRDKAGDYSHLWVKFGAGYDHGLTDALFLRAQALYGIGFASKIVNDGVKNYDDIPTVDANAALSHGLTVKVGVGYKF